MKKTGLGIWIVLGFILTGPKLIAQKDSSVIIQSVFIVGNDQTKERVILREITFDPGDTLNMSAWPVQKKISKQNLEQTNLFTRVHIELRPDSLAPGQTTIPAHVLVKLQERWYTWPYIILSHADRNLSAFVYNWDYFRVNYGLHLARQNLFGLNHTLKLKTRFGYKEQLGIEYNMPGMGKNQNHNYGFETSYFRQNEVLYLSDDNDPLYYRNMDGYVQTIKRARLSYALRQGYRTFHNVDFAFREVSVNDSVRELNPLYLGNNRNLIRWLELAYQFRLDMRDSRQYPLEGYRLSAKITRRGLGLIHQPVMAHTVYNAGLQGHLPLGGRFYASSGLSAQVKDRKVLPYYFSAALGYGSFARGFELYLIDGQNYYISKNEVKYMLLPRKYIHLKYMPLDQFNKIPISIFLKGFIDMAWVTDHDPSYHNPVGNMFLYSTGLGLDIVTYYDRIFTVHYSVNKFGQPGLFIDFTTQVETIL
jgi:outer membrane protein assembly factor BamA